MPKYKYGLLILIPFFVALFMFYGNTAVYGDGTFIDSGQLLGGSHSYDVALADFDGDGDLDAYVANFGLGASGENNTVWLNQGSGVFTAGLHQFDPDFTYHVALGDVDGDGDVDAFTGNFGGNRVWLNDGNGAFSNSGQELGTSSSWGVALGDLDGDNDLDAFVANSGTNEPDKVWLNQGGVQGGTIGDFADSGQNLSTASSGGVALGDVDGDGDLDAFVTHFGFPAADQVWLNDGSGNFSDSGQALGSNGSGGVSLADLDGDADLDAFVTAQTLGANTVWINQGGAQGGTAGTFASSGQSDINGLALEVGLADLDDDGDVDAFLPHYFNGAPNRVWLNDGTGQFTDTGQELDSDFSYGVALGDLDGDGDVDAFTANHGNDPAFGRPNRVWLNGNALPTPTATATATPTATPPPPTPQPADQQGWQTEILHSYGDTGISNTLRIGSDGYPALAFKTQSNFDPANLSNDRTNYSFAYWNGLQWQYHSASEDPAYDYAFGYLEDFYLTDSGQAHLLAVVPPAKENEYPRMIFMQWDGNNFIVEPGRNYFVSMGESSLFDVDFAIEETPLPLRHLVYVNPNQLRYGLFEPDDLVHPTISQQIDTTAGVGLYAPKIEIDSTGSLHAVYVDELSNGTHELYYARQVGDSWTIETFPAQSDKIRGLTLVVDSQDNLWMGFWVDGSNVLQLYENDGVNGWVNRPFVTGTDSIYDASLAVDPQGNAHFAYIDVARDVNWAYETGSGWQSETLPAPATSGESYIDYGDVALAIDPEGVVHFVYQGKYQDDLVYSRYDFEWQTETPTLTTGAAQPDLSVSNRSRPIHLTFLDTAVQELQHLAFMEDGVWQSSTIAPSITGPTAAHALRVDGVGNPAVSYNHPTAQVLLLADQNGTSWSSNLVGSDPAIGQYNQLFTTGIGSTIIHWNGTTQRIHLTQEAGTSWEDYPNLATDTAVGPLSAVWQGGNRFAVSHYDSATPGLYLSTWDAGAWQTSLVDASSADMGRLSSLENITLTGEPAVAYSDDANGVIRYAYQVGGVWQFETVTPPLGTITSLHLELGLGSHLYPRIAFSTAANELFLAYKLDGAWQIETLQAAQAGFTGDVSLGMHDNSPGSSERPFVAYTDDNGVQLTYRVSPLADVPPYNPTMPGRDTNDDDDHDDAVPFVWCEPLEGLARLLRPAGEVEPAPVGDFAIFAEMNLLFEATAEGQALAGLYRTHAGEMGQIALSDPALLWDSYRTLQNFLPGLEALAAGEGSTVTVTQQMVDDALDIWTRLADQAGPELANVINGKLVQTNNLQDYVGLTFDEWALSLGVNPPPKTIFLPFVQR